MVLSSLPRQKTKNPVYHNNILPVTNQTVLNLLSILKVHVLQRHTKMAFFSTVCVWLFLKGLNGSNFIFI